MIHDAGRIFHLSNVLSAFRHHASKHCKAKPNPWPIPTMFFLIFFLLIYLAAQQSKRNLLRAVITWASEESMQIMEPKKIQCFYWHRGPPAASFQARDEKNELYEIRLELHIRMVQYVRQIIKDRGSAYDIKLVSKKRL